MACRFRSAQLPCLEVIANTKTGGGGLCSRNLIAPKAQISGNSRCVFNRSYATRTFVFNQVLGNVQCIFMLPDFHAYKSASPK